MHRESTTRSVAKAISYRALGTMTTVGVAFALTREIRFALAMGGVDMVAKIGAFFVHERIWDRIRYGRLQADPFVLWFTGLSGSGKTTLSYEVTSRLEERGYKVQHIDGDKIRELVPMTGFTRTDRVEHLKRVGLLASYLEKNGVIVVASFIAPYEEVRGFIRGLCKNFIEVHVSTPLEECEKRDVKGLYAKARRGEIKNFTGISEPFEAPKNPEVEMDTSKVSLEESVEMVMTRVSRYLG